MSLFSWLRWLFLGQTSGGPSRWSTETGKFLDLAAKSGLRSAAEMRAAFDAFRAEQPAPPAGGRAELNGFCDHLARNNVLTRWQCQKLLDGRHKGFFLDSYRLFDHVGVEETCSRYAAEDTRTGRRVVLRVFPPTLRRRSDGQPYYEVDDD